MVGGVRLPRVHLIAGARPNFMKVAPLFHALSGEGWCQPVLVHTGQHYDERMSDTFLREFALPPPDYQLGVGSGSHAEQAAAVMVGYEKVCMADRPEWVVVVGDVNSTMACTLTAKKLNLQVAHLEAGLRSGDRTMPEEINRVVTDALADLLWTPSRDADENLLREGRPSEAVTRVGNIMIDALEMLRDRIGAAPRAEAYGLTGGRYGIVTLHRPSNVDDPQRLESIIAVLARVGENLPLILPVHPRTRQRLEEFGLAERLRKAVAVVVEPLGYVAFMGLLTRAALAISDSGGIQEEATYLGIPCLTLRDNTERPITITEGTNQLVQPETLYEASVAALAAGTGTARRPELWDGRTAARVAASLKARL